MVDLEGFLVETPFEVSKSSERFNEGSKVVPRPFFVVEVLVFQVIEVNCVRLGVLLLAKLNLLCLEIKAGCDLFQFIFLVSN